MQWLHETLERKASSSVAPTSIAITSAQSRDYFGYARKWQQFSPQENKVLLVAHVIKFNANRVAGKKTPPSRSKTTASARSQASSTNNNAVSQIRIKPGKAGGGRAAESSTTRVSASESKGRSAF
ncbi:hypothetical protein Gpo141_00004013 [Globisporangium polare]